MGERHDLPGEVADQAAASAATQPAPSHQGIAGAEESGPQPCKSRIWHRPEDAVELVGEHAAVTAPPVEVNACLTCPDFQTTPEFLDIHRRQASANRRLIARADANGQFRLVTNLRQVQASLERIIPALEALPADERPDDARR